LKILLISRRPIKEENYEQIQSALLIKEVPPLTDEEAVNLIQHYCRRDIYKDIQNNRVPNLFSQVQPSQPIDGSQIKRRGTVIFN